MASARDVVVGEQSQDHTVDSIYGSDKFRMFGFKIKKCRSLRKHDWTLCPFAHPGEKAERRDPREYKYAAIPCRHFRNFQNCRKGKLCEFAHGIFEYWLHPDKYRTQFCTLGDKCKRKVCFFAHSISELREETTYTWYNIEDHSQPYYAIGYDWNQQFVMTPTPRLEALPAVATQRIASLDQGNSELANILSLLNIRDGQYQIPRTVGRRG